MPTIDPTPEQLHAHITQQPLKREPGFYDCTFINETRIDAAELAALRKDAERYRKWRAAFTSERDECALPQPDAYRCIWFSDDGPGWQQWHDDNDPLPDGWDEPPDEVEPYYSAAQMHAALLQARKRPKTWAGPGAPLTVTRIFNHFHRTYADRNGAKNMFAAGVRWAEQQHGITHEKSA